MKNIFLLICFAFTISIGNAQQYKYQLLHDTLTTVSAVGSLQMYPGGSGIAGASAATSAFNMRDFGGLGAEIWTDSLSGSTAATLEVRYCYDVPCTVYHIASSTTLNGATTQKINIDDPDFNALYFYINVASSSGTQSIKIRAAYTLKRRL